MYYFPLLFWYMNWCMLLQLYNKIICSFFQWRYTQNWGLLWKTYRLGKEEGHYKKLTSSPNFNTSLASAIIISFVLSTTMGSGGQQQTIGAFANGSPSCKHNWQPYLPLNCFMHVITNCTENHIFFFQTSWKDCLSKKIVLVYDLSCIIGKDDISFSQKYDLIPLRRKIKDDLSQKIHGKMIFSSSVLKRWSFQKGLRWDMIFLVLSGKMVFFSQKHDRKESEERSFSRNTWKYEIFCVLVRVLQTWLQAPPSKKSKIILSRKNTPEGDWRSRLTF